MGFAEIRKAILSSCRKKKKYAAKGTGEDLEMIEDKIISSLEKERSSVITTPSGCLKRNRPSVKEDPFCGNGEHWEFWHA